MNHGKRIACFASALSALCLLNFPTVALAAPDDEDIKTIGRYSFSATGNAFADSSGNGNNLTNAGGVTVSETEYDTNAPTRTSAYFDGNQKETVGFFSFSSVPVLSIDWYMKSDSSDDRSNTIFQLGWNVDAVVGGFSVSINPGRDLLRVAQRLTSGWAIADYSIQNQDGWKNYVLTINNEKAGSSHFRLIVDGIKLEATTLVYTPSESLATFTNNYLWVGAQVNEADPFIGYLQDIHIYEGEIPFVPEPAVAAVFIVLGCGCIRFVRRKQAQR